MFFAGPLLLLNRKGQRPEITDNKRIIKKEAVLQIADLQSIEGAVPFMTDFILSSSCV
jgi:hypothetical protein